MIKAADLIAVSSGTLTEEHLTDELMRRLASAVSRSHGAEYRSGPHQDAVVAIRAEIAQATGVNLPGVIANQLYNVLTGRDHMQEIERARGASRQPRPRGA